MEKREMIVYSVVLLSILFFGYLIVVGMTTAGPHDDFAQCLSEKGIKMYGTDWCSHCQDQKLLFGKSFSYINFINCDTFRNECSAAGVKVYPTWIIENKIYTGSQSLEYLSSLSGCNLE